MASKDQCTTPCTHRARRHIACAAAFLAVLLVGALPVVAADAKPVVRELFVPYEDLSVVLQGAGQRVFLTREEYEALVEKASLSPELAAPHKTAMLSAHYEVTVEDGRARITGKLLMEVTADGLHAMPLALDEVGVRHATLDGRPAAISLSQGKAILLVEGRGRHELMLEMVVPVEVSAARQTIRYTLPSATTGAMRVTVPGNIEVKSGAHVLSRTVDEAAGVTRFELLPNNEPTTLVMTLNNKLAQRQQVVVARNVMIDELTETYERLHITASLKVVHGAASQFRFAVPDGFEIMNVASPELSRWEVVPDGARRVLHIFLRSPVTDNVILNLSAQRTPVVLDQWRMPELRPLDVAGSVSVVGLLMEERLRLTSLATSGLIGIDTQTLVDTLPSSIFAAEAGAPAIRPIAAYYAPQATFELAAAFEKPAGRVEVTSNILLIVQDSGLAVRGGFALLPVAEKIFGCNFSVPPGWHVTEVTYEGQPISFEPYLGEDGSSRIRVTLPHGVMPGQRYSIHFHATHTPDGWLASWQSQEVQFPNFAVAEATTDRGAVAVEAGDDLTVRAGATQGLVPLDEKKKAEFSLADVPTSLAFRYDNRPFQLALAVERSQPRISAETYSFLTIEPSNLRADYEIIYRVDDARARELAFLLPADTPSELSISGLDNTHIKEFSSQPPEAGFRRWRAQLAQPARGTIRIRASFQQPVDRETSVGTDGSRQLAENLELPIIRAADVQYQTGIVAVEGSAELEVTINTAARKVDVGELAGAQYRPGRRLLGAFGFVGQAPAVAVNVTRPAGYALPSAIVQRGELVSAISAEGLSQTTVRFLLRTKTPFVQVQLPATSTLWSVYVNHVPAKPQRDGNRLLINLPASHQAELRDLQIVYETPIGGLGMWGSVTMPAPKLFLVGPDEQTGVEVPLADLNWHVFLPADHRLADSDGTVQPDLDDWQTRQQLGIVPTALEKFVHWLLSSRAAAAGAMPQSSYTDRLSGDGLTLDDQFAAAEPESGERQDADRRSVELGRESAAEEVRDSEADIPVEPRSRAAAGRYWALEGHRSLKIDLAQQGDAVKFQSLGAEPVLAITLIDRQRLDMLAWGIGVAVVAVGLVLTGRSLGARMQYVVGVLLVATFLPLILGWKGELAAALDLAFYGAIALLCLYAVAGCWRWLAAAFRPSAAHAALVLVFLAASAGVVQAEDQPLVVTADSIGPMAITVVPAEKPLNVPQDAVIVPYYPERWDGVAKWEKVLVPYQKYVELWNLAYPDRKIDETAPPVEYSLAGARWQATLDEEDFFRIEGQIDLDVYAEEKLIAVPLAFGSGVLVTAQLDGQPARIELVETALPPNVEQLAVRLANAAPQPDSLATLYVTGKGHKQLSLAVRYRSSRLGGWRVVEGRVPAAIASALTLTVPKPETEVRLSGLTDRAAQETSRADERIETALSPAGTFKIQWRPKVAQATVDRSLTVDSDAVVDVQEDSVRVMWQLNLQFPLGHRDLFTILLPSDYLVEQVVGENVRSWEVRDRELDVALLKPAHDGQQLTLHLARRGTVGSGELARFDVPLVQVAGALLHEGRLAVRRSPLLELRVEQTEGLVRTEIHSVRGADQRTVESPLGIQPFQAYRFTSTPFVLGLSAIAQPSSLSAEVQTVLRMAEEERTVESRVVFGGEGRPVYSVMLDLPAELDVEQVVAPGDFQWSVAAEGEGQVLRLYFAKGQTGSFAIVVRGMLGTRGLVDSVALPRIGVRGVARQESTIVVQTDPSFDARVEDLNGCQTVLLSKADAWLATEQRTLARLAVHCPTSEFSGQVRLEKRTPRVTCQTVSNLRVTGSTFEETILLDFSIENAGLRELSFLLPRALQAARITAPMVRQKTIEPVANTQQVRVRLELQDEVIGQLRVLIENDRLLSADEHAVPIPVVETGRTNRQFVCLESAGRDEVLIQRQQGLEPLGRQQEQWSILAGMLGEGITQAFGVRPGEAAPELFVRTKDRQAVETVGARIPLAQTTLSVDASGAYRGIQTYQVDNRTEQFLQVKLPAGARLWTARVAGDPVKPIVGNGVVRIPLVKTAQGDQDYVVELKYGGRMETPTHWSQVSFPLMHTENVQVQQSQVRLELPKTHRWFRFGGSMRLVEQESDFIAGYLKYKTGQLRLACESLASSNPFTQERAKSNLKNLASQLEAVHRLSISTDNSELRQEIAANSAALQKAQVLLAEHDQQQDATTKMPENRRQLNDFFYKQSNEISRNIVNSQGGNFDANLIEKSPPADEVAGGKDQAIQIAGEWFDQSGLKSKRDDEQGVLEGRLNLGKSVAKPETNRWGWREGAQRGYAPDVAAGQAIEDLKRQKEEMAKQVEEAQAYRIGDEQGKLRRFQQRLDTERQLDATQAVEQALGDASQRQLPPGHPAGPTRPGVPAEREPASAVEPAEPFGVTGGGLTAGGLAGQQRQEGNVPLDNLEGSAGAAVPPRPTGLASLDVELPARGIEYLFTTPRGEIEIVARAIDQSLLIRLFRLVYTLVAVALAGLIYRQLRNYRLDAVVNRGVAILLILGGLSLLVFGLIPLIALAAILLGFLQIARLTVLKWTVPTPASG